MAQAWAKPSRLLAVTPRLRVHDVVRAAEFYRDSLGFTIEHYDGRPPRRAMVSRDGMHLILDLDENPGNESHPNASDLEFTVDDLDLWAAELESRGISLLAPGISVNGVRRCRVKDADGHVLEFVEVRS